MRTTEDHIHLKETDHAYEIMYQYINPEVSVPYPEKRKVAEIPAGTRIWATEVNCRKECERIKKQGPRIIEPGKKILPL